MSAIAGYHAMPTSTLRAGSRPKLSAIRRAGPFDSWSDACTTNLWARTRAEVASLRSTPTVGRHHSLAHRASKRHDRLCSREHRE